MPFFLSLSLLLLFSPTALLASDSVVEQRVTRVLFTPGIKDFEPMGSNDYFYTTSAQVYFFTELKGFKGQVLKHRWFYKNKQVSEIKVTVRSNRWRAATRRSLPKTWVGEWRAEVVNSAGVVLESQRFEYRNLPY